MDKHTSTPGPWEVDAHMYASCGAIWGPDGMTVCHVADRGGTTRDNARLIAAAPTLLAALERLVEVAEFAYMNMPRKPTEIEDARAAIKKARGLS